MNLQGCIDELLVSGTEDWVCNADFRGVARDIGGVQDSDKRETFAIELMREVVRQGLMEIGDLPEGDTGQRPLPLKKWPGTPEEWLDRIEREWPKRRGEAEYGVYCWFQNTVKGDEIARQILAKRDKASQADDM